MHTMQTVTFDPRSFDIVEDGPRKDWAAFGPILLDLKFEDLSIAADAVGKQGV